MKLLLAALCLAVTVGTSLLMAADAVKAESKEIAELRIKAERGHAVAQCNLGVAYDTGQGVPKDEAEAVKWFRKAADQENASAQSNLGVMYANGRGVPKDARASQAMRQ